MLGDFQNQGEGLARLLVDVLGVQGVQDRRELAVELDVDDGADDLGDLARARDGVRFGLYLSGSEDQSASAPAMISISSVVIWAWRLRLYCKVRALMRSPALRVALSMAPICAAKKLAWFS